MIGMRSKEQIEADKLEFLDFKKRVETLCGRWNGVKKE